MRDFQSEDAESGEHLQNGDQRNESNGKAIVEALLLRVVMSRMVLMHDEQVKAFECEES